MAIQTNRDYVKQSLSKFNLSDSDIDLIFIENSSLNPDGAIYLSGCKLAIYNSLSVSLPVANVSEEDMSIAWNMDALKVWYGQLCTQLGKRNVLKPAIRDRSNYW